MKCSLQVFAVLLSAVAVSAETHITGDLHGMTLDVSGNPYIVEQDIIVPPGKKVVIKDGCVFLFKPFTGLQVQGHLVVQGSAEHQVIFTSINDQDFNKQSEQLANPFDWNGILVSRESGTVSFTNFQLRYSVYGIKSQNPNIQVSNGIFKANGQFHFTINDKIQYVQDNIAFDYYGGTEPIISDTGKYKKPEPDTKSSKSMPLLITRYSCLGVGVVCAGIGTFLSLSASRDYQNWKHIEFETNPPPLPGEYENRRNKYNASLTGAIITDVLAGLGFIGFGVTFLF